MKRGLVLLALAAVFISYQNMSVVKSMPAASIHLPFGVSSGMILQRNAPVVWDLKVDGANALQLQVINPNGKVIIEQTYPVDRGGKVTLAFETNEKNLPAGEDYSIRLSTAATEVTLRDVAIGELILCSGQSNMAWNYDSVFKSVKSNHFPDSGGVAGYERFLRLQMSSKIRTLVMPSTLSTELIDPLDASDVLAAHYGQPIEWTNVGEMRSQIVGVDINASPLNKLSLVCAYAAHAVFRGTDKVVPTGLIQAAKGGIRIEYFMRSFSERADAPEFLKQRPEFQIWNANKSVVKSDRNGLRIIESADLSALKRSGVVPYGSAYGGMLYPLRNLNPGHLIWSQGESNANTISKENDSYVNDLMNLVSLWGERAGIDSKGQKVISRAPKMHLIQISNYHKYGAVRTLQAQAYLNGKFDRGSITAGMDLNPEAFVHYLKRDVLGRRVGSQVVTSIKHETSRNPIDHVSLKLDGPNVVRATFDDVATLRMPDACVNEFKLKAIDTKGAEVEFTGRRLNVQAKRNVITFTAQVPSKLPLKSVTSLTYGHNDVVKCFVFWRDVNGARQILPGFSTAGR